MKFEVEEISGCYFLAHENHGDSRGMSTEIFNVSDNLRDFNVAQVFISRSMKNVIRGLHYSKYPHLQDMIVTCLSGSVKDVLVDIRIDSPTFSSIYEFELDETLRRSVFIPSGVAHGYEVMENNTLMHYLLSRSYDPRNEFTINPIKSGLEIYWETTEPILSKKDANSLNFEDAARNNLLPIYLENS